MATERGAGFGLTEGEAAELQRRVRGGETHVVAAAGVGCCAKTVQRLLRAARGESTHAGARGRRCGCR